MRVPNELLRERLQVRNFAGSGARGPQWDTSRYIRGSVQQTSRLVTDGRGIQVTVEALVIIRPEAGPVPPESLVFWNGLGYRVVTCYPQPDSRRPSHWELAVARVANSED